MDVGVLYLSSYSAHSFYSTSSERLVTCLPIPPTKREKYRRTFLLKVCYFWTGGRGFGKFFNNVLILLALIGLSQAFLLSSVVVSSTLPFLDLVADHCLCHIVMPYFQLLWNTLTSWISVYFSVVLIVVYNVHRMRKADREAQGKISKT